MVYSAAAGLQLWKNLNSSPLSRSSPIPSPRGHDFQVPALAFLGVEHFSDFVYLAIGQPCDGLQPQVNPCRGRCMEVGVLFLLYGFQHIPRYVLVLVYTPAAHSASLCNTLSWAVSITLPATSLFHDRCSRHLPKKQHTQGLHQRKPNLHTVHTVGSLIQASRKLPEICLPLPPK